ncbi:PilN domain-containing protein [Lichenicoccus sp.]|uniref:PilN domain-containing protein n=1 Tax=Lichenicoccus sp. TaxID=2781899 RepID=UPI003D14F4BA
MLDLIPERFARRDPASVNAIVATPEGHDKAAPGATTGATLGAVRLSLRRDGHEQQAGRHEPGQAVLPHLLAENPGLPLLLRLPPDSLLSRDVTLPLAAEAGFERVLHYEMDRLTPFAADDVFWSARVLRRNKDSGRLDLRLSLVPRAWLAAPLETLAEAGGRLTALEVAGGASVQRIAVAHEPGRARLRERRLLLGAAGLCAALALVAIVLPFVLQSVESAATESRIPGLQPRVDVVEALRRRLRTAAAGADTIADARRRVGDTLAVLAALTRVLPDDTYLTDVTLRDGIVTLTGESAGAVKLIPALSADPTFVAPAFSAPVTRIESNNSDLFSIRAQVAGAGTYPGPGDPGH